MASSDSLTLSDHGCVCAWFLSPSCMSPACHAWLRNKLHRWSEARRGKMCDMLTVLCCCYSLTIKNEPWCVCYYLMCSIKSIWTPMSDIFHVQSYWHKFLTLTNAAADDDKTSCYILINIWQARVQGGDQNHANKRGHICVTWWYPAGFFLSPSCHNTKGDKKDATQRQHWWDNKTVEIGSWTENGSGRDTGDRCLVGGW